MHIAKAPRAIAPTKDLSNSLQSQRFERIVLKNCRHLKIKNADTPAERQERKENKIDTETEL